jgi:hypothetical protein
VTGHKAQPGLSGEGRSHSWIYSFVACDLGASTPECNTSTQEHPSPREDRQENEERRQEGGWRWTGEGERASKRERVGSVLAAQSQPPPLLWEVGLFPSLDSPRVLTLSSPAQWALLQPHRAPEERVPRKGLTCWICRRKHLCLRKNIMHSSLDINIILKLSVLIAQKKSRKRSDLLDNMQS